MPSSERSLTIGVDLVAVDRVARLLRDSPALANELFTARELDYSEGARRDEHLAARFAAKEAVVKALGNDLGGQLIWSQIEVVNDPKGRPHVHLHGEAAAAARRQGVVVVELSMSHSGGMALAQALVIRSNRAG